MLKDTKMKASFEKVEEKDVLSLTVNARFAALRWDIVEWHLVWDLDVPAAKGNSEEFQRALLCFQHLSTVAIPFDKAQVENGFFLTSEIKKTLTGRKTLDGKREFSLYEVESIFSYDQKDKRVAPNGRIAIEALSLSGIISSVSLQAGKFGLDLKDRRSLGSEDEIVRAVSEMAR